MKQCSAKKGAWPGSPVTIRYHLLTLGLYTLLAIGLSYPLPLHLTTHVPGSATWALDEYSFVWNLWWFRHALLALGQSPLNSTHIFYPIGVDLGLYTFNLLNGAAALPLIPLLPLPLIHNLQWWGSSTLSAFGAYLLATELLCAERRLDSTHLRLAPFLAGLVYAFASYRGVFVALGHYSTTVGEWSPFFFLYFLRTLRRPTARNAILAGIFMGFTLLASHTMAALTALAAFFYLLLSWRTFATRSVAGKFQPPFALATRLLIMGTVAILVGAPALLHVVRGTLQGTFVLKGWGDAAKLSADLAGFLTPPTLHPLWGHDWVTQLRHLREGTARFTDVNVAFTGYVTLALAFIGLVAHRRRAVRWAAIALAFALLSLGPLLHINSQTAFDLDGLQTTIPLPYILLHYIPFLNANRVPSRNITMVMLMLSILVAYGAAWLLGKGTRQRDSASLATLISGVIAALLLFEHLTTPVPLTNAQVPDIYRQIAADKGDYAILSLPIGWRNSCGVLGVENTRTQYYQTTHGKRLLGGNTSRNPAYLFDYYRRLPVISSLIALETYGNVSPEQAQQDRALVEQFISFFDIRYVVINRAIPGRPPYVDTRERTARYVRDLFPLEKIYDSAGTVAYRVTQAPPPETLRLDLGSLQGLIALGEGWDKDETIAGVSAVWATNSEARLFVPVRQRGQSHSLTLRVMPFSYPASPAQTLAVQINGRALAPPAPMQPKWDSLTFTVPDEYLHLGLNDVVLRFGYVARPADVLPGNRVIGATGRQTPADIEVNSGGPGAGDLAYITVGGQDASAHREGYNVAIVDPASGAVVSFRGFDTTANAYEADRLAKFLAEIPQGRIVVVVAKGNAAEHLTPAARQALQNIGAQHIPASGGPQSYAIIGVQGVPVGTALEAAPAEGNAYLRLGGNPDHRTLAAAFDWVEWR